MSDAFRPEPWERIAELVATGDGTALQRFLDDLPAAEAARAVSRLDEGDQRALLGLIGPEDAADLLEQLSEAQAVELIEDLPAAAAAAIVDAMPSDEQADLLGELSSDEAAAILAEMSPAEASDARQLLQYPSDTAGGLMITEYVAYPDTATIGHVVANLREQGSRYSDLAIQYVYITDPQERLTGVLRLRDLLLAQPDQLVGRIMIADPLHVAADTSLETIEQFFDQHPFVGVPVTDTDGRLVGVVQRSAAEEALEARATQVFLAVSGLIGEEELRSMPLAQRTGRRLAWLSINIVLNIVAASVIAFYQDTLSAVIALAVFLPIISDMSGCSGNQAVAVSIRELALGLVKPYEMLRVVWKEGALGLLNGLVLGALLGGVAYLWKGNLALGLVVGGALFINTVVSVLLGGLIPLALKAIRQDPALASGPILTTVTDMCGFFLTLSFATGAMAHLTV